MFVLLSSCAFQNKYVSVVNVLRGSDLGLTGNCLHNIVVNDSSYLLGSKDEVIFFFFFCARADEAVGENRSRREKQEKPDDKKS